MAVNKWQGSTGNWATAGNWSDGVPNAGDEIVFDSSDVTSVTEGMLPSETGVIEFDGIHIKKGYTGDIGSASEPLALGGGVAGFPIIIEGSGTYHIVCTDGTDAGSTADASLPLVIINNPDATVNLYSQDNDAGFVSTFIDVHLIAGTLNSALEAMGGATGDGTGAVITNLYIQPRSAQSSNVTAAIAINAYRIKATAAYTNIYMANGTLSTDSGMGTVHLQNGTINFGTDGGGGTNVDIATTLKMYGGTLNWNPNEDSAFINEAFVYGGTIAVSKTINEGNTRTLGGGAGNDVFYFTGSKLNLDGGQGQVTVTASSQLLAMGGRLTLDSFTEMGITNNPDIS